MDSLHFIPNNILTRFLKELTKCKNDYQQYLNFIYIYIYVGSRFVAQAQELGYEPNTINLQRVDERVGLLTNWKTASKDLKDEQMQKNTDKT